MGDEYDWYDILPGDSDLFLNTVVPTGDFGENNSRAYARPNFIDLRTKYDRTLLERLTWKFFCDYNGLATIRKYSPWNRSEGKEPIIIRHPNLKTKKDLL